MGPALVARVKPGGPLERRTPLASGRRLPSRSVKRAAGAQERVDVWSRALLRDGGCLLRHTSSAVSCAGRMTPHHLQKASACGPFTDANIVVLCAFHNGWVEDHPYDAKKLGLVVTRTIPVYEAAVRRSQHGVTPTGRP